MARPVRRPARPGQRTLLGHVKRPAGRVPGTCRKSTCATSACAPTRSWRTRCSSSSPGTTTTAAARRSRPPLANITGTRELLHHPAAAAGDPRTPGSPAVYTWLDRLQRLVEAPSNGPTAAGRPSATLGTAQRRADRLGREQALQVLAPIAVIFEPRSSSDERRRSTRRSSDARQLASALAPGRRRSCAATVGTRALPPLQRRRIRRGPPARQRRRRPPRPQQPAACRRCRSTVRTRRASCPTPQRQAVVVSFDVTAARPRRADRPAAGAHRPGPVPDRGRHAAAGRDHRTAVRLRRARAGRGARTASPSPSGVGRLAVRRAVRPGQPQARPARARWTRSPTTTSIPAQCGGDLSLQLAAGSTDTVLHALRDIARHTRGGHAGALADRRLRQPAAARRDAAQPARVQGRHRQPGRRRRRRRWTSWCGSRPAAGRARLDGGRQLPGDPGDPDARRVLGPGLDHRAGAHDRPAPGHRRSARRQRRVRHPGLRGTTRTARVIPLDCAHPAGQPADRRRPPPAGSCAAATTTTAASTPSATSTWG